MQQIGTDFSRGERFDQLRSSSGVFSLCLWKISLQKIHSSNQICSACCRTPLFYSNVPRVPYLLAAEMLLEHLQM